MKNKLLALSLSLAFTSASSLLYAEGNVKAGQEKSTSCAGCHGDQGNSMMPLFPKLAQQHSSYIKKQLIAFKEGTRSGPTMAPMVAGLSDQDMNDLSAFYAAQTISTNKPPEEEEDDDEDINSNPEISIEDLLKLGSKLYKHGNLKSGVSACIACHAPGGEGNKPAAYPLLKSQHADYLMKSLQDYKSGKRNKNSDDIMSMIAAKMTEQEIKAVSYHISMTK